MRRCYRLTGDGAARPAAEADLLWGALRVHGRRAFGPVSAPAWRGGPALAVALWPFLMPAGVLAAELLRTAGSLHYAAHRAIAGIRRRAFLLWGPGRVRGPGRRRRGRPAARLRPTPLTWCYAIVT
ncbi:hypothetical protein Nocox_27970 [Nonomuraea coxensis DSM 45129]|uniref:Uncharacterized protein n=1 Tax=Nonomuraea coxensis DSM 45129 TaxID=1122611 RepID=A0ABX8U8E4_9ACTN|nr:hypothetical protein [Nonomuraea coxensis]QYC43186.1 hypothetical protein Nocox_27970 [Nonomuraea coxensis DSM 45129]